MIRQVKNERIEDIKQELTKITREFCLSRIDQEYAELCERLIVRLSQLKPAPLARGKTYICAAC